MAKGIKTHLFLLDDYRSFTGDVRKKFSDSSRYAIDSFQAKDEFLRKLASERQSNACKIAVLGIHDPNGADQLLSELRKADAHSGIIFLCPPDKIEDARKNVNLNVDCFIPLNGNAILRIHNTVKKLFSEHYLNIYRKRRNRSLLALLAFIILTGLAILIASLKFPEYF
ncbi:MAG TPA: hypothetical protein VK155_15060 [Bacteroidales bacterium]|jgi:FixJ family two-component response regulator|nr:hypothetical protein [Bacteroidales bacterium]